MRILVLGGGGMLGNAMFDVLSDVPGWQVYGTLRSTEGRRHFAPERSSRLLGCDVEDLANLARIFREAQPEVVVNCVALSRGLATPVDPLRYLSIYSVLPQRLAQLCGQTGARLIQIGTDGVFAGVKGGYREEDIPEPQDIYGVAKLLGEVRESHTITLRTSVIGHALQGSSGLVDWFLSQQVSCKCFTKAIFSGFPTVILAEIVRDHVIPRPELYGMYHVASRPISKFDLLALVARQYGKQIEMTADESVVIDRSLDGSRFHQVTGYTAPDWPEMVSRMHTFQLNQRARNVQG